MTSITIIIPCFNEEKRLNTKLFENFSNQNNTISFLFVNDGSTDLTVKTINKILSNTKNNSIYNIEKNPLSWLDTMLNGVEHMNFFEGRATEYSKASTQGTWTEAFS